MIHQTLITIFFLLTISLCSCKNRISDKSQSTTTVYTQKINKDSLQQKLNENLHFIGDSLLNGKTFLLKKYIENYQPDSCVIIAYEDTTLRLEFEGVKNIDDINGDKISDTVFVIPPFNFCDDGYSYSFFDPTLPRLFTGSYCCHPDNLFSIGDIDEDGISEICIFYSSCTSRFKSLIVYSLRDRQWTQIGRCTFDIGFMKPDKEKRVRKINRGKFEMLEIVDKEENKEWKRFSF